MDLGDLLGKVDLGDLDEVLGLVRDNKESLAMLGRLPDYLGRLADGLNGAGQQARSASLALIGEDGKSGVRSTLAESAEALSAIVTSIGAGADRIKEAADKASRVPLMDGPAERLAGAASEMSDTTGKLGELARAMDTIGDTLAQVGEALAKLGDHLDDSGAQARGFADLPAS